jgi:hypothetical protein
MENFQTLWTIAQIMITKHKMKTFEPSMQFELKLNSKLIANSNEVT